MLRTRLASTPGTIIRPMLTQRAHTPEILRELIWEYYAAHGRDLPWRKPTRAGVFDAYHILVSEMMLQQTQVSRVIPKYQAFLTTFPTAESLANAPLAEVLRMWSGLGYNRRARYLQLAAAQLCGADQPWQITDLVACKGIGHNTAAAVVAYAYNQPVVFIETNIRTVLIHHFFANHDTVADSELVPLMEALLDTEHPREFYWALMDYGSHLKVTVGNASRASKHYVRQSPFAGSKRQVRGAVLRALRGQARSYQELANEIPDERLQNVVDMLAQEGLITLKRGVYHLG